MIKPIKNGISSFTTSSILTLAIPHPINKTLPTGGVQIPIHRFDTNIIPKCTGFNPSFVAIGKNIGVNIKIVGVKSINVPVISKITFINNKIIILLSDNPKIAFVIN